MKDNLYLDDEESDCGSEIVDLNNDDNDEVAEAQETTVSPKVFSDRYSSKPRIFTVKSDRRPEADGRFMGKI